MHTQTKFILVGSLTALIYLNGCSSKAKKEAETTPAAKPATATTTAKPGVTAPKKELPPIPQKPNETKCVSGKDERIISVQSLGQGCQVVYTKQTEISPIATSAKSVEYCETVAQGVREKLEAAGFKCQ